MAKSTRNKIKENFEGIHRNFSWITEYNKRNLELIKDVKPKLSSAIRAFQKGVKTLDDLALDIYSKL